MPQLSALGGRAVVSRVDEAWNHDPRILWALIIEDEDTSNVPELGEIAERVFVNAQEAWDQNARLRAEVHSLSSQLDHERRLHHDDSRPGEQVLRGPGHGPGAARPVLGMHTVSQSL